MESPLGPASGLDPAGPLQEVRLNVDDDAKAGPMSSPALGVIDPLTRTSSQVSLNPAHADSDAYSSGSGPEHKQTLQEEGPHPGPAPLPSSTEQTGPLPPGGLNAPSSPMNPLTVSGGRPSSIGQSQGATAAGAANSHGSTGSASAAEDKASDGSRSRSGEGGRRARPWGMKRLVALCCPCWAKEWTAPLRFRTVFVLVCIFQVVIACVAVWAIGYNSVQKAADSLSTQLFEELNAHAESQVSGFLRPRMGNVEMLGAAARNRFPHIQNQHFGHNLSGVWTDLVGYIGTTSGSSTATVGVGCGNFDGSLFYAAQPFKLGDATLVLLSYQDSESWPKSKFYFYDCRNNNTAATPLCGRDSWMDPTKTPDDWVASGLVTYAGLGPAAALQDQPYYRTAIFLKNRTGWQQGVGQIPGGNDFRSSYIATIKVWDPISSTDTTPNYTDPLNNVTYVTPQGFCTITMSLAGVSDMLAALPFGTHGSAFLMQMDGTVIGASISDLTLAYQVAGTVYSKLQMLGVLTPPPPNPYEYIPATPFSISTSLDLEGGSHTLTARTLGTPGLNWVIVVVTKDSDFNGEVTRNIYTAMFTTVGVVLVSILITFYLGWCFTLPLLKVVDFMKDLTNLVVQPLHSTTDTESSDSIATSASQRVELIQQRRELLKRWAYDPVLKDDYLLEFVSQYAPLRARDMERDAQLDDDEHPHYRQPPPKSSCFWRCIQSNPFLKSCALIYEVVLMHKTFGRLLKGLCESMEETERTNDAKRQFTRYIFHEIRVPFNTIVLGVQNIKHDSDILRVQAPEVLDTISLIDEQSNAVSRILNDVLSLSKLEEAVFELEYAPFDIVRLIHNTIQGFQTAAAEKRIMVSMELQPLSNALANPEANWADNNEYGLEGSAHTEADAMAHFARQDAAISTWYHAEPGSGFSLANLRKLKVFGDQYRLGQVLANLVSNAIKFTNAGGDVKVVMSARRLPSRPPHLHAARTYGHLHSRPKTPNGVPTPPTTVVVPHAQDAQETESRWRVFNRHDLGKQKEATGCCWPRKTQKPGAVPPSPVMEMVPVDEQQGPSIHAGLERKGASPHVATRSLDGDLEREQQRRQSPAPSISARSHAQSEAEREHPEVWVELLIAVKDTGVGIQPEFQNKIFRPYSQFSSGELQRGQGTGLGLSISKSLVQLHGGKMSYKTFPRVGSTFYFTLPVQIVFPTSLDHEGDLLVPLRDKHHTSRPMPMPAFPSTDVPSDVQRVSFTTYSSTRARPDGDTVLPAPVNVQVTSIAHPGPRLLGAPPSEPGSAGNSATPGPGHSHGTLVVGSARLALGVVGEEADRKTAFRSGKSEAPVSKTPSIQGEQPPERSPPDSPQLPPSAPANPVVEISASPGAAVRRFRLTNPITTTTTTTTTVTTVRYSTANLATPTNEASSGPANTFSGAGSEPNTPDQLNQQPQASAEDRPIRPVAVEEPPLTTVVTEARPDPRVETHVTTVVESTPPAVLSRAIPPPAPPSTSGPRLRGNSNTNSANPGPGPLRRVLLVEDSPPTRKLMKRLLEREGFSVSELENGQLCVDLFTRWITESAAAANADPPTQLPLPCDVILMDNFMPEKTGEQATRELRELGITIPIVGLTGNALREDVMSFMHAGVNQVLTKPVNKPDLLTALSRQWDSPYGLSDLALVAGENGRIEMM